MVKYKKCIELFIEGLFLAAFSFAVMTLLTFIVFIIVQLLKYIIN